MCGEGARQKSAFAKDTCIESRTLKGRGTNLSTLLKAVMNRQLSLSRIFTQPNTDPTLLCKCTEKSLDETKSSEKIY